MLKKGTIKLVQPNPKNLFISSIFIVPKQDWRHRPVIKQAQSLSSFQNGGAIALEWNISLSVLNNCEFQVVRYDLPISFPLLWSWVSSQDIYKITENSHFSDKDVECSIDIFSGLYFIDRYLRSGVDT